MEANAILTPMKAIHMELEAANKSDMSVHGMCNLELSVHGLIINMDALVVDLNCHAILGMDILGDASKLPFILDLVKGTLSGGGYETIQLHRFQAATECFAETTDSVCIPPHSEVMLWAKLKTNNGRRGPTAGVVLALQTFVQEFGLLVGRSLVRADADDWKIPILIYNSDPCTMKPADCTCNPVIVPAHTRIARVEEIQAIQHIGSRETEINTEEGALPPHLIDVLDAATELTSNQRARAATLLAKHVNTFPAPGTPITGRTEAVMHDIDTGSTWPIRCNPRKLSPKKIGNLVHRELRADPPPGDPGTYASWVQQALYESYDEVRAQQQRATHRQKRNYDSKAVARAFPIGCWTLRYYPPARKNKLCSPWIGPYKIVRAPMEWVVGIQIDADSRIAYVHMDDLNESFIA